MNNKLIFLSAIITAIAGTILGIAAAEMSNNKYQSRLYRDIHVKFALVGGVAGFVIGAGQESVRQLKGQRDLEEENR
ncbi:MAG: hypothetical protein ACFBSE_27245 [Prochloraceae cyanobacterium]